MKRVLRSKLGRMDDVGFYAIARLRSQSLDHAANNAKEFSYSALEIGRHRAGFGLVRLGAEGALEVKTGFEQNGMCKGRISMEGYQWLL
jgi:hypothetical protein